MIRAFVIGLSLMSSSLFAATTNLYKVDPTRSELTWKASKKVIATSHHGTVKLKEASIETLNGLISGMSATIDMSSIANQDLASDPTNKAKLEGHLKSADFFDVKSHPYAMFKAKSVSPGKDKNTNHVTGDLTLKNITKTVNFPVKLTIKGNNLQAESSLVINRTDWGIKYNSDKFFDPKKLGDKIIKDEVEIGFKLTATQSGSTTTIDNPPATKPATPTKKKK